MKHNSYFFLVCLGFGGWCLLTSSVVWAGPIDWNNLNSNEQTVLKNFQGQWKDLSEVQQKTLQRWAAKSPADRGRIKQRYQDWAQLSPAKQQTVIRQLNRYRQMSVEQRARLKAWHQWLKKLPGAEREKIYHLWPSMSDTERRTYINDLQKKYGNK